MEKIAVNFEFDEVDLFVRSWVEIRNTERKFLRTWSRPLREVVSWNEIIGGVLTNHSMVDLFVRSWVEIRNWWSSYHIGQRRPLREVVSWNIRKHCNRDSNFSRPLREVVSWNFKQFFNQYMLCRRPLREVVSWNILWTYYITSSRGRPLREVVSWNVDVGSRCKGIWVDLFVRSWVEIPISSVTISLFAFRTERQFREKSISSTFNESASDTRRPHTYSILTSIGNTIWHISLCLF